MTLDKRKQVKMFKSEDRNGSVLYIGMNGYFMTKSPAMFGLLWFLFNDHYEVIDKNVYRDILIEDNNFQLVEG